MNVPVFDSLQKLNDHLINFSYVGGYAPSQEDVKHLNLTAKNADLSKFPNVARWKRHIESFQKAEISAWPAEASVATSNAPATSNGAASGGGGGGGGAKKDAKKTGGDDDDFDLFDDDEDDEEYEKQLQERIKKMEEEKAAKGKVKPTAKSMVVFDVKPWDAETDMALLEKEIRTIEMDGLVWSKAELKAVAYGIKKLCIAAIVEDDKVSSDDLQERIEGFEDLCQSVDVVSFSKL